MTKRLSVLKLLGVAIPVIVAMSLASMSARQLTGETVRIDNDDLGGVVTSAKGPEAGVWVIAETNDLPTKLIKTVVTDDRGRYVVPDLPKARYSVWVRGYGLVDSPKVEAEPGKIVNLTAVLAANPRAAAEYYPSNYWYALLQMPPKSDFPGTGPKGNGIGEFFRSQAQWIEHVKTDSCESCHQLGDKATREIQKSLGIFDSSMAAWDRRIQSGQDGGSFMNNFANRFGRERLLAMYAGWTDRIAAGEYPREAPPRPQGAERNVVITQWDWAAPTEYFHDAIASDKRNPSVNANGSIYGVHENSSDHLTILDPTRHTPTEVTIPVRDQALTAVSEQVGQPSPYWGNEQIWSTRVNAHSNTMDHKGRVWNTSRIRPAENPAWCRKGSSHPSAMAYPLNNSGRQYSVYDSKTKQFTLVDTCFGTFHLNFAWDANNTMWSGSGGVVGWVNVNMLDATGDEQKSQGWTPLILDTNGNGRRDAYVEPDQPMDPRKDKRIQVGFYGISPSPADGSIWGSVNAFPGAVVRVNPGSNPTATALAEIYEVPWNDPKAPGAGYSPRGIDVDRNGVLWTVLASGHLASFDRRKCKGPLNGPTATGSHCPEGWSFYPTPGPNFKGNPDSASADSNYYAWVDGWDSLGLGTNVPIATGNGSDSMLALVNGKFVVLRVPYPLGFFNKQIDGRIDNPKTGWKGKGLWTTYGTRVPYHLEGGKGTRAKVVKFQLRPDPLAR
jgi:hypothetical protein